MHFYGDGFSVFILTAMLGAILVTGCQKQNSHSPEFTNDILNEKNPSIISDLEFESQNKEFSLQTLKELLRDSIATAKYLDFDKSIADGYADINV